MANVSEELNFLLYLILVKLTSLRHMWLVATALNDTALYTQLLLFFQYLYILFISLFLQPLFTSSIADQELQLSRYAARKWTAGECKQNTGGL